MEFTSCAKDSWWCGIAYLLTQSAGKIGTPLILICAAFFYTLRAESLKQKILTFFKSVITIGVLLAVFAFVNENLIKKITKLPRPSHLYMVEKSGNEMTLDSIYSMEQKERQIAFQKLINDNPLKFDLIDQAVLDHWIEESGFSFPSGHSFNAFLLAVVLTYNMKRSRSRLANKLFLLPLMWAVSVAVSRVAIGAHSALDVSFGVGLALVVAHLFLYFDHTKHWLDHRGSYSSE